MSDIVNLAAAIRDILSNELKQVSIGIEESKIENLVDTYFKIQIEFIELVGLPKNTFNTVNSPYTKSSEYGNIYEYSDVVALKNEIDVLLAVWSQKNSSGSILSVRPRRIFISHGRNEAWRKVQEYIEKTIEIPTLQLAQEANRGRTIFQKLIEESDNCAYAVVIMTGDDTTADEQIRARENVLHEIGYFQGKYGASKVCLLHEDGVNIPTNIQGVAYIPFPKGAIEAALGGLTRELKYI